MCSIVITKKSYEHMFIWILSEYYSLFVCFIPVLKCSKVVFSPHPSICLFLLFLSLISGWNGCVLVALSLPLSTQLYRFDVRGYLTAPELKKYESTFDRDEEELSREERLMEEKCDRERYRDMQTDEENANERQKLPSINQEQDQSESGDKQLNAIDFDYSKLATENATDAGKSVKTKYKEEIEEEDFILPDGLYVPSEIVLPKSMRMHNLIEKTAKFISSQGTQMEIILKTKQSNNSQFNFLGYDCPLNAYYKNLIEQIKHGKFVPKIDSMDDDHKEEAMIESDNDSDGDYHLHPSLKASLANNSSDHLIQVPATLRSQNENSAYSKLVRSLQDRMANEPKKEPSIIFGQAVKYIKVQNDLQVLGSIQQTEDKFRRKSPVRSMVNNNSIQPSSDKLNPNLISNTTLSIPPLEIETIIDKLAQYVNKNGDSFERSIRDRNEARFSFLNTGHEFYAFYVNRKNHYEQEKQRLQKEEEQRREDALKLEQQKEMKTNYTRMAMEAQKEKLAALRLELLNRKRALEENEGEIQLKKERDEIEDEEIRVKLEKMKQRTEMKEKEDREAEELKKKEDKKKSNKKTREVDTSLKEKQEERKRKAALFLIMLKKSDMIANSLESHSQETPDTDINSTEPDEKPALAIRQPAMIDFSELPKLNSHLPFFARDQDLIKDRRTPSPKTKEKPRQSFRSSKSAYEEHSRSRSLSPVSKKRRSNDRERSQSASPSKDRRRKRNLSHLRSNSRSRSPSSLTDRRRFQSRSHSKHSSSTRSRRRTRSRSNSISRRPRSYRDSSKSRRSSRHSISPTRGYKSTRRDRQKRSKSRSWFRYQQMTTCSYFIFSKRQI